MQIWGIGEGSIHALFGGKRVTRDGRGKRGIRRDKGCAPETASGQQDARKEDLRAN